MIYIYSDSQIVDLEWIPRLQIPHHLLSVIHSIEQFDQIESASKIAFVAQRLHADHDADMRFESKVRQLSQTCRLVFCIESELHNFHWSIWSYCHRENVYWVLPGTVNDRPEMSDHIIYWGDWFKTTSALYKALPEILDQLTPYQTKSKSFDALLGSPKPHREFVSRSVQQYRLHTQFVMTYGGRWSDKEFYAKDYFIYEPGTEVTADLHLGTMDWARYHGQQCHLSQIIPISVFNQTAYSVVAETDYDNTLSFFSEKTVKPIIARRLFVVFSGYKFLHNLKSLGFRTFENVIDESYDLIQDGQKRYQAAFDQIRYLCSVPQQEIFPQIKDTLEHNYHLMLSTDWTQYAITRIQSVIDDRFKDVLT